MGALLRKRLRGLAFLAICLGLLGLTVVIYNKALPWEHTVDVTLRTTRIGHQLIVPADVKLRGIVVGEVRAVTTDGTNANMRLALEPDQAKHIPNDVSARILPKTLFGEKFVDLVVPPGGDAAPALRSGDVIGPDRSRTAIELETVFNDLLPLLKTLKPEQLSTTLTNIAEAVRGQGDALGANLEHVDAYLGQLNPQVPQMVSDLSKLADVADTYNAAAPDLLRAIDRFTTNAQTVSEKRDTFAQFLTGTQGFATTATRVVSRNADNLIQLAAVSRPTLQTLARYSPEFTCLLVGLDRISPLISSTFTPVKGMAPALHITLQVLPKQPQGYAYPLNKPKYDLDPGPDCHGLPGEPVSSGATFAPSAALTEGAMTSGGDDRQLAALAGPMLGVPSADVPGWVSLYTGPLVRGLQVRLG